MKNHDETNRSSAGLEKAKKSSGSKALIHASRGVLHNNVLSTHTPPYFFNNIILIISLNEVSEIFLNFNIGNS